MNSFDWTVIASVTALVIGMSWLIGRRQKIQSDYYRNALCALAERALSTLIAD